MILAGAHWSWTPYHVARKIDMVKELQLSLWLVGWVHGRGKDIFQGGPAGEFPKIFSGGPKVVVFTPRNWKKTCFASKFTIQGAFPPSDAHGWVLYLELRSSWVYRQHQPNLSCKNVVAFRSMSLAGSDPKFVWSSYEKYRNQRHGIRVWNRETERKFSHQIFRISHP